MVRSNRRARVDRTGVCVRTNVVRCVVRSDNALCIHMLEYANALYIPMCMHMRESANASLCMHFLESANASYSLMLSKGRPAPASVNTLACGNACPHANACQRAPSCWSKEGTDGGREQGGTRGLEREGVRVRVWSRVWSLVLGVGGRALKGGLGVGLHLPKKSSVMIQAVRPSLQPPQARDVPRHTQTHLLLFSPSWVPP